MAKYRAHGVVSGSKYLGEFEASNEEEAEMIAESSEEGYISFCHNCVSQCENAEILRVYVELIEGE